MTTFQPLKGFRVVELGEGIHARAINGERMTLAVVDLEPNAVLPEHRHDNEQLGVLVAGAMTFTVGGETRELRPGATWRIPSDVPHSVVTGPDGAVAVEVFAPRRDDWSGLQVHEPSPPRWP